MYVKFLSLRASPHASATNARPIAKMIMDCSVVYRDEKRTRVCRASAFLAKGSVASKHFIENMG